MRDAVTTRLLELRLYDRVFRACGFMGVFYDVYAHQFQLALTRAELRCANAIPAVYDRCVGRASGVAMWRGIVDDLQPARFVPCVAAAAGGFRHVPHAGRHRGARNQRAGRLPRQRAATRTGAGARRSVSAAGPA